MKKIVTICFVVKDGKVLLGYKKRGFGEGLWNGFGGKVEPGETIQEAMRREMLEESGVVIEEMHQQALITFKHVEDPILHEMHAFFVSEYFNQPVETEEMIPKWFVFKDIPYAEMWPDDAYWLQRFLDGEFLVGDFCLKNKKDILSYHVATVDKTCFL